MKKKYLIIPVLFVLVSGIVAAYNVHIIIDMQKRHIFEMLTNQVTISSRNLQKFIGEFEADFQYALSTIPFHKLLTRETVDYNLMNQMRRFYSKYQNIVIAIQVFNPLVFRELYNSQENYFNLSKIHQNHPLKKMAEGPVRYLEDGKLYYLNDVRKDGKIVSTIEIQMDFARMITNELKNSYISQEFQPWCVDADGKIITFLVDQRTIDPSALQVEGIQGIVSDITDNYFGEQKHSISINRDKQQVFSVYYPIRVFGERVGIVLSVGENKWLDSVKTKMAMVIGNFLMIIILVILVFSFILWKQVSAELKLKKSEAKITKILENIQAGVLIIDRERHTIEFANELAAEMAETTVDNLLGKPCQQMVCPSEKGKCPITDQDNTIDRAHRTLLTVTGKERDILKTVIPMEYEGRLSLLETFVDITDLKRQTARANELAEKAASASRAKSEFLANMSHEFRTPMNAIIGMSHLALTTELTSSQTDYLKKISEAAQSLMTILNSVFDYSRIDTGQLTVKKEAFQCRNIMTRVKDQISSKFLGNKKLAVQFETDPLIPDTLIGDGDKLKQVLVNLSENAVKFTDKGKVSVKALLEEQTPTRIRLHFSVRDTGIGISADQLESLFEAFTQADTSNTRKYGGTGLGLAISKRLVKLMHGELAVQSTPGKGSEFSFTLEFERGGDEEKPEIQRFERTCILVLDGCDMDRQIIQAMLEKAGISVSIAQDGKAAMETLKQTVFHAVVVDTGPLTQGGYDTLAALANHPDLKDLPVIAMSAKHGARKRAMAAGANDFIEKPIMFTTFFDRLNHLLKGADDQTRDAGGTSGPPKEGAVPVPVLDIKEALARVQGNQELLETVLKKFYQNHKDDMETLHAALAEGNMEAAGRLVHKLKGSVGVIGASGLNPAIVALETALKEGTTPVNDLVAEVSTGMTAVLSAIGDRFKEAQFDTAEAANIPIDVDRVMPLLKAFETCLKESDLEATQKLDEIKTLLKGTAVMEPLKGVEEQLQQYDFDEALAAYYKVLSAIER